MNKKNNETTRLCKTIIKKFQENINKTTVIIDINKILAYSAKNSIAKPPPPYSILNPDTNSDSPSAKSKGARLVSANLEVNHVKINGTKIKRTGNNMCTSVESSEIVNIGNSKIKSKLTS